MPPPRALQDPPRREESNPMRSLSLIPLLCLAPLLGVAARAADAWDEFRRELIADRFSGVVLVARGDAILFEEGIGFANRATSELITPDTAFRIGSLTKAITAAAVTELANDGRLDLHAPIRATWPEWPAGWADATADRLLLHTAGLPEYTNRADFPAGWMPAVSASLLFQRLGSERAAVEASAHPNYSNTHYVLLGALIERVTGQSYADFVATRICTPARMTRTQIWPEGQPRFRHAIGYEMTPDGDRPVEERAPGLLGAAGAFSATAKDLHRFVAWQARHDPGLSAVKSGQPRYGWVKVQPEGRSGWACIGQVRGFSGAVLVIPEEGISVVVLSNLDQTPALPRALRALEAAAGSRAGSGSKNAVSRP